MAGERNKMMSQDLMKMSEEVLSICVDELE